MNCKTVKFDLLNKYRNIKKHNLYLDVYFLYIDNRPQEQAKQIKNVRDPKQKVCQVDTGLISYFRYVF